MIPIPNVVAGVLIGYTSPGWTELLVAAAAWPIAYCAYVSLADRARAMAAVAHILSRAHRRLPGSPMLSSRALPGTQVGRAQVIHEAELDAYLRELVRRQTDLRRLSTRSSVRLKNSAALLRRGFSFSKPGS
jgi:hypothetical protein